MSDEQRPRHWLVHEGAQTGTESTNDPRWLVGQEPSTPLNGEAVEISRIDETRSPFDPDPRPLCPDPILGTREGWKWCARCAGIREPEHVCYRPPESE